MKEFDLSKIVDRVLRTSDEPDPHVLARQILMRIPAEHLAEACVLALVTHVQARNEEMTGIVPLPELTLSKISELRDAHW